MGADQIEGGPLDGSVLDYRRVGPTVLRMLVGMRLRQLRQARGIPVTRAGYEIRASESKISRLELGRHGFKRRDVVDLLTFYGICDVAEQETLLTMAEQANVPGWWHAYDDVIPDWFDDYLGLEQGAGVIRGYEVQIVPGLLQTEDYARAVIRLGHPDAPESETERRVELRMRRQRSLHRSPAPSLWVVIDEAALLREFGDTTTMRAQLRHLAEVSELPHVTVQVMPFSAGGHAAAGGPVTILRFPQHELLDVVYLEHLHNAIYPDKPADIDHYWHMMNRLVVQAAQPEESRAILRRALREH